MDLHVPKVRQHLQVLPTAKNWRHGRCQKMKESKDGAVHVEGGARRHGLSAGRDTTTVHSEVAVVVGENIISE